MSAGCGGVEGGVAAVSVAMFGAGGGGARREGLRYSVLGTRGRGRGVEDRLGERRAEEGRGAGSGRSRERRAAERGRGGGGRGVATYHTPSIPKSRGRLAPRQIAVASTPRFSSPLGGTETESCAQFSRKWGRILAATRVPSNIHVGRSRTVTIDLQSVSVISSGLRQGRGAWRGRTRVKNDQP